MGQRPPSLGKRELHQDGRHYPLVSPAIGGEGVRGANGVSMAGVAVDLLPPVPVDRVVAAERRGAFGNPMTRDMRRQHASQTPRGPTSSIADAVIARRMLGGQRPNGSQQDADRSSPGGQNGRQHENHKTRIGRPRERAGEFLDERLCRLMYTVRGLLAQVPRVVLQLLLIPTRRLPFV